jgi:hypothetical protein
LSGAGLPSLDQPEVSELDGMAVILQLQRTFDSMILADY